MPGFVGFPEILLLGLLALVLFGPKRLPEMGRGLGKGMREFKESITGDTHVDHTQVDHTQVDHTAALQVTEDVDREHKAA